MPTIDELAPVVAAADADCLPVSQAGAMRRVSRSQLLAGVQPSLALPPGSLLGRVSGGVGGPEAIGVGENLRLQGGVLSASPAFRVSSLAAGGVVVPEDGLAASQGGRDARVTVGGVLKALERVPGLDVSGQVAAVPGGVGRSLSAWLGDGPRVEAFGAVGDGSTDDTAAIDRAVASGLPVRFGARTYVLNGQWTVTRPAVLLGVPGTVLLRRSQAGGAWISVQAGRFAAVDVTFDAGAATTESWGVLVEPSCTTSWFERCAFLNASGAQLGCGLTVQARDGAAGGSRHRVIGCEARGNAAHGIWMQAAMGAGIEGCEASGNGGYGICLDFNDPAFLVAVRSATVSGCRAWKNRRGISVGNFNETNLEPPRWGHANPDAMGVSVVGNRCHDNWEYGLAVSGRGVQVSGNVVERNGSGVLANATAVAISDNVVVGPGQFGIDVGGCVSASVTDNVVTEQAVGINCGGSRGVRVAANTLAGNVWGVTAYAMETDAAGVPFGIACSGLTIEDNGIALRDGTGGGVLLADGPEGVAIVRNGFSGGEGCSASQAVWAHTDQVLVEGNRWNNAARWICNPVAVGGLSAVRVPDALDGVMVTSADGPVGSVLTERQAAMAGRVSFVRVTAGGQGYTRATVRITGSGTGASAVAQVRDGAVVGVSVTGNGAGYGDTATVAIEGDGSGALARAFVGLPVPEGRRMRVHCNGAVTFARAGSRPFQDNWTGADITVPAGSVVEWVGAWGGWQAVAFPPASYVSPSGDGELVVRSVAHDVVVRPAAGGQMRVSSATEPVGFASLLGRGSPEGVVAAPPGSDYRNLNGGAGATMWLKRTGTGATGWSALG